MAEHGMIDRPKAGQQAPTTQVPSLGTTTVAWIATHRRLSTVAGIAAVGLIALALGAPLGAVALVGLALLCPLMMIAMMFGMHGMHGGHHGHGGGDHPASDAGGDRALDILRERYARGELTEEQYDRMRRELS